MMVPNFLFAIKLVYHKFTLPVYILFPTFFRVCRVNRQNAQKLGGTLEVGSFLFHVFCFQFPLSEDISAFLLFVKY